MYFTEKKFLQKIPSAKVLKLAFYKIVAEIAM